MASKFKLPKQWRHWARMNGMKPHGKPYHKRHALMNMIGKGRVWRIAYDHEGDRGYWFQGGDRLPDFDRWARSVRYDFPIPRTLAEFTQAVRSLKDKP
jgi:hypothetical protein